MLDHYPYYQQETKTRDNNLDKRMKIRLSPLFFVFFSSFFPLTLADDSLKDMNYWCNTTPHPEPCLIFMEGYQYIPREISEFRTMLVQVALDQALHAQTKGIKLGPRCRNKRRKAAWVDCSKLYENTILQLNRTYQDLKTKTSMCTNFDAQTWLSTALTNLETCRMGSQELNVSNFISTILSSNVSELISNSLAVNERLVGPREVNEGYPSWISKEDRKLLETSTLSSKANYVVSKHGSRNFRSIQEAINHAVSKRTGNQRIIIHVKKGVYTENIVISHTMSKISLIGDGMRFTIITGSRSVSQGYTTYNSATVGIEGPGFIAHGITFRNTAGPQRGQAVALRSASDLSAFYSCAIEGYQDTLFVHSQRQFFKTCYIYGTIDFIFGNAAVVFQNCMIYVRKPLWGQPNVITAQGRGDPYQNTGISIQSSQILAAPDLAPVVRSYNTYLGRPWQKFSRTVFLKCYFGSLISPKGWLAWRNSNFAQTTVFYGEYRNFGPGANLKKRVKWKGRHVLKNPNAASQFTVESLIAGGGWLPGTGVPYTAGL